MTSPSVDAAGWYRAITLAERAALLGPCPAGAGPGAPCALERRWRSQAPFTRGDYFERRLAQDDLREDDWRRLLGLPAEAIKARAPSPPGWLEGLVAAYERPAPCGVDDLVPEATSVHPRRRGALGLFDMLRPLLAEARSRLGKGVRAMLEAAPCRAFDPATVERVLLADMPAELLALVDRAIVLEMHIAGVEGRLPEGTPRERYEHFVGELSRPEVALALFRQYPVLGRQAWLFVEQWVSYGLEFLGHLEADWGAVCERFGGGESPGPLARVRAGAGDRHRDGRAVMVLQFSSGLGLVYKPKALAVDVHFQELLAWLNGRGFDPPLRPIEVLDRGAYGWIEFVAGEGCESPAEVGRFFRRQGAYAMLLYALGATDFHYENLIAAGEHPVLIDLETLLQPYLGGGGGGDGDGETTLYRTVLRSGILPQWIGASGDFAGVEISGLGARRGQKSPVGMPGWDGVGTDAMRFMRQRGDLPMGNNRASLGGVDAHALDHADEIVAGFVDAYRFFVAHREALLAPGGPLDRFARDEVRVILRGTQRYAILRYESFHPALLGDALDRDRAFDRLWADVEREPHLAHVIPSERADLWRGDIPMFFTTPSSTVLRDARGRPVEGVLDEPSLAQVGRTIAGLGERDLLRQVWFLRAALATLESREGGRRRARRPSPRLAAAGGRGAEGPGPARRGGPGPGRLVEAARAVGDLLASIALREKGSDCVDFLGPTPRGSNWALAPVDANLYSGGAGVALFLGHLGAATGDGRYTALARAALRGAARQATAGAASQPAIGAFEGWGSLLYALTQLGALWRDPALLADASAVVARIAPLAPRDEHFDVIGGAAGCIPALLGYDRTFGSAEAASAAIACGDRLLAAARPAGPGVAWPSPVEVVAPLTGFAHGAAGIAWALLLLADATGEERFRRAAMSAIAYERGAFVPAARNWPDWRRGQGASEGAPKFEVAWCHGALGIGLARLPLARGGDAEARLEVDLALEAARALPPNDDHCLCHGDFGMIELFSQAARAFDEPKWQAEADRRTALLLDELDASGPACGLAIDAEPPGLMTGLAGIGYGLLRAAAPERVPSVLTLEPPPG